MHRLFVAIDLPDTVKKRVADIRCELPGAHWVAAEQLHLTLRFIGGVDDPTMAAIKTALKTVSSPSLRLFLSGISHFPPAKHPRVLWVGVGANQLLLSMQHQVEKALNGAGIPPEERRFSPHITIARLNESPSRMVLAIEEKQGAFASDSFAVTEFHLYSSTLTRNGAIHIREATFALSPLKEA